jgi:hypothetical protein
LATRLSPEGGREHKLRGAYAEWFVAGQVQIAGGSKVIVARHEVRVGCVGLLVHDLTTYHVAGLPVHSGLIRPTRRFALNIEAGNFFLDDQLWFVILGANPDGTFSDTAYLIPSSEIPHLFGKEKDPRGKLHYQTQIPANHLTAKWRPYAVPTKDLGKAIVERVRRSKSKGKNLRAA